MYSTTPNTHRKAKSGHAQDHGSQLYKGATDESEIEKVMTHLKNAN